MKKMLWILLFLGLGANVYAITFNPNAITFKENKKSCDAGESEGCFGLGVMYLNGDVVKQDHTQAMKFSKMSCDAGHKYACHNLAHIYRYGLGTAQDFVKASSLYDKSCKRGDAKACHNLALMYTSGSGVKKDYLKAVPLYKKACDGSDAESCYTLGTSYYYGKELTQNFAKAKNYFTKACDLQDSTGCYALGKMYEEGEGAQEDIRKAMKFYEQACTLGSPWGCSAVALSYYDGKHRKQDYDKASVLFEKACALGDSKACSIPMSIENSKKKCDLGYVFNKDKKCIQPTAAMFSKTFEEIYQSGTEKERTPMAMYYFNQNDTAKATKLLRKLVAQSGMVAFRAGVLLNKMHEKYAETFKEVTPELLEKSRGVIGLALMSMNVDKEKINKVLLQEAYYLKSRAQMILQLDYKTEGTEASYREAIFSFYKECSDDGILRCHAFLGEVYLYGLGDKTQDTQKAINYIERAGLGDTYNLLGNYFFYKKKDMTNAKVYYKKAIDLHFAKSAYGLAIVFQVEKNYDESVYYLNESLRMDKTFSPAKVELAWAYIKGMGVKKDLPLAIGMLEEVMEDSKNPKELVDYAMSLLGQAEYGLAMEFLNAKDGNKTEGRYWMERAMKHGVELTEEEKLKFEQGN